MYNEHNHKTFQQNKQHTDSHISLIQANLQENILQIKNKLGNSSDVVVREILIGSSGQIHVGLFYMDGITDVPSIQFFIKESLLGGIHKDLDQAISYQFTVCPISRRCHSSFGWTSTGIRYWDARGQRPWSNGIYYIKCPSRTKGGFYRKHKD